MSLDLTTLLPQIGSGLSYLLLYSALLPAAVWSYNLTTPYDIHDQLHDKNNDALAISIGGFIVAVTAIYIAAAIGPSQGLVLDLLTSGAYTLLGVLLLHLSRHINDRAILFQFDNKTELIDQQNRGTGAVQAGSYLASGLIIAGAIHGEGGGPLTALAFFALGQLALILVSRWYNHITPFCIHDEIEAGNVAAGIALAGTLAAQGIIMMGASAGHFVSWTYNLSLFAGFAIAGTLLLPILRTIVDHFIVPHMDLNHEIAADKNLGAGLLECLTTMGFACVMFFLAA